MLGQGDERMVREHCPFNTSSIAQAGAVSCLLTHRILKPCGLTRIRRVHGVDDQQEGDGSHDEDGKKGRQQPRPIWLGLEQ